MDKLTKLLVAVCAFLGIVVVGAALFDRPMSLNVSGKEYGSFEVVAEAEVSQADLPERMESVAAKLNINSASKEDLMTLNGIGEKLSERIIEERNFMPFESVEDLLRVDGIGKKTLEKLRPYIVV